MRVFSRTIIFYILSLIFASLPINVYANNTYNPVGDVVNFYTDVGNGILESSEYLILRTADFWSDVIVSVITTKNTYSQTANAGGVLSNFLDRLSDYFVPLFSKNIASPNVNTDFNATHGTVSKPDLTSTPNQTTGISLPGTRTIVERIIERSSYPVLSLNSLDALRTEFITLNATSIEYLKNLINRTEYKSAEVTQESVSESSSSGTLTSVDASGGSTGLSFTGGPLTSSGTLTLSGTLAISNGGTGTTTAPTYGQLLLGNSGGTYDLVATSSLGITATNYWTSSGGNIYNNTGTNVGIGSTTPYAKLSVKGAGTTTGVNFQITDSSDTPLFTILDSGNVGVGTTSPFTKLSVAGATYIGGNLTSSGIMYFSQTYSTPYINPTDGNTLSLGAGLRVTINAPVLFVGASNDYSATSITNNSILFGRDTVYSGSNVLTITQTQHVGDKPTSNLKLLGQNADPTATTNVTGGKLTLAGGAGASSFAGVANGGNVYIDGGIGYGTGQNGYILLGTNNTGNVGIGTTTPSAKLAVTGTGTGTGQAFVIANSSNAQKFTVLDNGNVGIGNSNPATNLEIGVSTNSFSTAKLNGVMSIVTTSANNGYGGALYVANGGSNNAYNVLRLASGIGDIFIVTNAGNVGIGETAPGSRLSVSGGATIGASYDTTAAPTNGLIVEGNVGIGTTTPWGLLSVNPNGITGPSFVIGSSTATQLVVTNGGNVGIGNINPIANLDIGNGGGESIRVGSNGALEGGLYFGINSLSLANSSAKIVSAYGGNYDGYLSFYTKPSGGGWIGDLTERMRIDNAGKATSASAPQLPHPNSPSLNPPTLQLEVSGSQKQETQTSVLYLWIHQVS